MGAASSRSQAKSQARAAEAANRPQPFDTRTVQEAPAWLQPILEQVMGGAMDLSGQPRSPTPLFSDTGAYQSLWQPPPGPRSAEQQGVLSDAYGRREEIFGRELTPDERARTDERVAERRGWDTQPAYDELAEAPPGFQRPGGRGFGGGGRGGFGGGGPRGELGGLGGIGGLLMEGARGPNQDVRTAMDSLAPFMGGQHMQPAVDAQQQLMQRQMDPMSPMQALIDRGMAGGLNAAAPRYEQFTDQVQQRFDTPSAQLAPPTGYEHLQFYNPGGP